MDLSLHNVKLEEFKRLEAVLKQYRQLKKEGSYLVGELKIQTTREEFSLILFSEEEPKEEKISEENMNVSL